MVAGDELADTDDVAVSGLSPMSLTRISAQDVRRNLAA
jgi:hypothetical protein